MKRPRGQNREPRIYDQLSFDKGTNYIQWRKDSPSINTIGKPGCLYTKK